MYSETPNHLQVQWGEYEEAILHRFDRARCARCRVKPSSSTSFACGSLACVGIRSSLSDGYACVLDLSCDSGEASRPAYSCDRPWRTAEDVEPTHSSRV